jgi:branched-subunit amino acid ABC-type transport system permease component
MDAIFLQLLNGLDKGSAYALIALGLTLIFGTLGVVNFAHGALFMIGGFCAVSVQMLLKLSTQVKDESIPGLEMMVDVPYLQVWLGDLGLQIISFALRLSILLTIPLMLALGVLMERGLIRHFYHRTHADQILVTFGLAIVLQELIKTLFGATPIPVPAPDMFNGSANVGEWLGLGPSVSYPWWRLVYFLFSTAVIAMVFAFLQFTTFGMVVRAGMRDRETVGLLGIHIERRFTIVFGIAVVVAGVAGAMYTPIVSPNYRLGMDFLVLSFVVVVVGGMGSLPGAVASGFLLGILQSFASLNEVKQIFPGIDQVIVYLVAVVILLTRPRGLMGRKGVMED